MKTLPFTLTVVLLSVCTIASAQKEQKKESINNDNKAAERTRSLGGQRTENELKDDKSGTSRQGQNTAADTTGSARSNTQQKPQASGEVIPTNEDQQTGSNPNSGNAGDGGAASNETGASQQNQSNTPAVIQRTSSESGSPSILSNQDGKGRDGTNNVQRSTPNIAGSPVPGNMNLSRKNRNTANVNTDSLNIREQEEQPLNTAIKGTEKQKQPTQANEGRKSDTRQIKKAPEAQGKQEKQSKRKSRKSKDTDAGE
jgi:hypothetical protein